MANRHTLKLVTGEVISYSMRINLPNNFWLLNTPRITTVVGGVKQEEPPCSDRLEVNPIHVVWTRERTIAS